MEIWQIASVLGLARPEKDAPSAPRGAMKVRQTSEGASFTPASPHSVEAIERRLAEAKADG